MTDEREWHRPKKPYTVVPNKTVAEPYQKKPFYKPKPVVVTSKNNENNKALHQCVRERTRVRVSINNLLSSDTSLQPTYEGTILRFDDFTILIETLENQYLINKSSISVLKMLKQDDAAV